MILYPYY